MKGNIDVERDLAECRSALRRVAAEWSRAEDEERHRIAAGLHDDLGQLLATIGLGLHEMTRWASEGEQLAVIDDTKRLLDQAVESIRSLTFRLMSPPLDDGGLETTLRRLAVRLGDERGIVYSIRSDGSDTGLSEEDAVVVFRVVRELLTNVAKHSDATKAVVEITGMDSAVGITVTDDGRGFVAQHESIPDRRGVGLLIARERLGAVGGSLRIDSTVGEGTTVAVMVPLSGYTGEA